MSGRCTVVLMTLGEFAVPCPCGRGEFDAPLSTECKRCTHSLFQHEDASPAPAQDSMSQSQGMASSMAVDGHVPNLADEVQSDPLGSQRKDTVSALWERLQQVRVVHVRGTPASGKSTLANLLTMHVRTTKPDLQVYKFSWPANFFKDGLHQGSPYYYLLNYVIGQPIDIDDWLRKRVLLIIDEAQGSYEYPSLWNDFLKCVQSMTEGPLVALFSSYGSPSSRLLETPTPFDLTPPQRISIRRSPQNPNLSLFFTRSEFDDVVARACKYYGRHGQAFRPSSELEDYIWEFTNGHPAGVRTILECLNESEVCIS